MKISFYPESTRQNKYSEIITSLLKAKGVKIYSLSHVFSGFTAFKKVKVVHLNWFENLNEPTRFAMFSVFFKRMMKLITLRVFGKKVIWTMHNKMPHDKSMMFYKKTLIYTLVKLSNTIIIHSRVSEVILQNISKRAVAKIRYIPHPDYIGVYGAIDLSCDHSTESKVLKLLFLGAVKPYKNIELLIDVISQFDHDVYLTIAGQPQNVDYQLLLVNYAKNNVNVHLDLNFIPDEMLPCYIAQCDLLVMPYDMRSSLNSGSVILAFSYKKTVICPRIGTILDMQNQENILSYTYTSDLEHFDALTEVIGGAIQMKKTANDIFEEYGERIYEDVMVQNNKDKVIHLLMAEYAKF
ncbi:glycosyltransferase [Arcticibacter eurypsychrophilus]|uniref:glycosyltransferase n=1 Tax=Arcticibacter eurypsychrophilus TaxID=1434752 RepID=UPI00084CFA99|nr:glycosyltransferase [Arcticibacter eurypsychrophilus]